MKIEIVYFEGQGNGVEGLSSLIQVWFNVSPKLPSDYCVEDFIESLRSSPDHESQIMARRMSIAMEQQLFFLWHKPAKRDTLLVDEDRLTIAEPSKVDPKSLRRMLAERDKKRKDNLQALSKIANGDVVARI